MHDFVECAAIDHEVSDYRKSGRTPRFYRDDIAVIEFTHVQLAGRYIFVGSVGMSVDIERAHTADTLAAIVVEHNRFFTLVDELLIEYVEHFEERAVGGNILEGVLLESPFFFRAFLTPDSERYIDGFFHNRSAYKIIVCNYVVVP